MFYFYSVWPPLKPEKHGEKPTGRSDAVGPGARIPDQTNRDKRRDDIKRGDSAPRKYERGTGRRLRGRKRRKESVQILSLTRWRQQSQPGVTSSYY